MTPVQARTRVVALDVRSDKFGYAVFEGPERLLSFGLTGFATPDLALRRLEHLLRASRPMILVFCRLGSKNYRRLQTRARAIVRAISRMVRVSGPRVAWLNERQLRTYFSNRGIRNKEQRASRLAALYRQLATKVPPPRKLWQHEHWYMPAFDAVAIAVVYFELLDGRLHGELPE